MGPCPHLLTLCAKVVHRSKSFIDLIEVQYKTFFEWRQIITKHLSPFIFKHFVCMLSSKIKSKSANSAKLKSANSATLKGAKTARFIFTALFSKLCVYPIYIVIVILDWLVLNRQRWVVMHKHEKNVTRVRNYFHVCDSSYMHLLIFFLVPISRTIFCRVASSLVRSWCFCCAPYESVWHFYEKTCVYHVLCMYHFYVQLHSHP